MTYDWIIQHRVGQCHGSETNLAVVRKVLTKTSTGRSAFLQMNKADRKQILRDVVACHQENVALYHSVTRGGRW